MDGTKHLYDDSVYPNGIAGLPPGEPYLLVSCPALPIRHRFRMLTHLLLFYLRYDQMAKEIIALYETTASNSHAGDEELVFPKLNEKKMKRLREILRLVITKTMEGT